MGCHSLEFFFKVLAIVISDLTSYKKAGKGKKKDNNKNTHVVILLKKKEIIIMRPWVLRSFRAKTDLSLPLNQVYVFCHLHKAFQIWSTVSRSGKKHSYQIFHRDLLRPNSKYFQRFHLLCLTQLLPMLRLSIHVLTEWLSSHQLGAPVARLEVTPLVLPLAFTWTCSLSLLPLREMWSSQILPFVASLQHGFFATFLNGHREWPRRSWEPNVM